MFWGAIIGAVIGAAIEIVGQKLSGKPIDWAAVGKAALVGAVTGLVGGAVAGRVLAGGVQASTGQVARATVARRLAAGAAGGASGGAAGRVTDNAIEGRPLHDGVATHAVVGAGVGMAAVPVEAGLRRAGGAVVERLRGTRGSAPGGSVVEQPTARAPPTLPQPGETRLMDPRLLRFSQRTAGATEAEWTNGLSRADALRQSMRQGGWQGDPIDGVITREGVVVVDNTRAAVAREVGLERVPVRLHAPDEPLPPGMLDPLEPRFGPDARTWGDALRWRTGSQNPPLPPEGTLASPRLPGEGTPPVKPRVRTSRVEPTEPAPKPESEGFSSRLPQIE